MAKTFGLERKTESGWEWVSFENGEAWGAYKIDFPDSPFFVSGFITGKHASDAMGWLEGNLRIKPLPESAMVNVWDSSGNDWQNFAAYADKATDWRAREKSRFESGQYKPLPWAGQEWFDSAHDRLEHFAHISEKSIGKISYTENAEKGVADRQCAAMAVGRYLQQFKDEYGLEESAIAGLVAEFEKAQGGDGRELRFATSAEEIERVYRNDPSSCMAHSVSSYMSDQHPVRAYGDSDLSLAYILARDSTCISDGVSARALVWKAESRHGRIYGDESRLKPLLQEAGFYRGKFDGAKIPAIPDGDSYLMPYIDDIARADLVGDNFILGSGDFDCQQTEGRTRDDDLRSCDCCGDGVREDEVNYVESSGEWVCESCYDSSYFYCELSGRPHPNCERVTAYDSRGHRIAVSESVAQDVAQDYGDYFEFAGEWFHIDLSAGMDESGDHIPQSEVDEGHYSVCFIQVDRGETCTVYPTSELWGEYDGRPVSREGAEYALKNRDEFSDRLVSRAKLIRMESEKPETYERNACNRLRESFPCLAGILRRTGRDTRLALANEGIARANTQKRLAALVLKRRGEFEMQTSMHFNGMAILEVAA